VCDSGQYESLAVEQKLAAAILKVLNVLPFAVGIYGILLS
jgi:hypothetical protein